MHYADHYCTYQEIFEDGKHFYVFTGPCIMTGKSVSVKVPGEGLFKYRQGDYIQDALSELSKDDREFLMSGYSKEGWDMAFGDFD